MRPAEAAIARLDTVPGVGRSVAEAPAAAIGAAVGRFPTAKHPASWAGVCPGNRERAGRRRGGTTRKGRPRLRAPLGQAARRGTAPAAAAGGHPIPLIADHLPTEETTYRDRGGNCFDGRDRQGGRQRLARRPEGLGDAVRLTPTAIA
jgi:transposase